MKKIINHLKDNWIKYGFETLVVTVGILGAFTLNNWNEARKDKKVELRFYQELRADLLQNKDELEGIIRHAEDDRIYNANILYNNIISDEPDLEQVNLAASRIINPMGNGIIFNIANSTYKYMSNEGFDFIEHDSLRLEITKLYEVDLINIKTFLVWQRELRERDLRPTILKYGEIGKYGVRSETVRNAPTFDVVDIQTLQQDRELRNHLRNFHHQLQRTVQLTGRALRILDSLVKDMDGYIYDLSGARPPAQAQIEASIIENIVGEYVFQEDSSVSIISEYENRVFERWNQTVRGELFQVEDYHFKFNLWHYQFTLDDQDQVVGLHQYHEVGTVEYHAKKVN